MTMYLISRTILGVVYITLIFGGLLFLPARTLDWPRAWIFLGVTIVAIVVVMFTVFPGREDLLKERFKPGIQKGQPLADKVILLLFMVSFYGFVAFIPVDVFRLHLLSRPGPAVSALGLPLYLLGWMLISLAFRENAFAAPVVKHQKERNQTTVDTGVYGFVRHPMYAGFLPLILGMALWLESYAALLLAIIPIAVVVVRIGIEERFLKRELEGYESYTQRVRHRLIPFFW